MKHLWKFSILFPFITIMIPLAGLSQDQVWYFGDQAGIDFNTSPPVALTNNQMVAEEGCASISDTSGNLLFYTNGVTVWNANHVIMTNGTGLAGDLSTTMGALIVPMPGDTSKYYLFTADQLGGSNGMKYSIVDMTLQGGLGEVTSKNTSFHSQVAEKMIALQNCDGTIWVISHEWGSSNFFADLITPGGINPTVVSSVGTAHSGGGLGVNNSVGQMAVSPQGNRIAIAMRDAQIFEVFDFDRTTGVISNAIPLSSTAYNRSYGVAFSPDGDLLYGTCLNFGKIFQFNLNAGNSSAIKSSAVLLADFPDLTGAMKLGLDGRIYVSRTIGQTNGLTYLATINSPNVIGVGCNLVDNSFTLSGKKSLIGLPNHLVFPRGGNSQLSLSGDTSICMGDSSTITIHGSNNVQWIKGVNSQFNSLTLSPDSTTEFVVIDLSGSPECADTLVFTINVDSVPEVDILASDTVICLGDSVNLTAIGSGNMVWSGGLNSTLNSVTVKPVVSTQYYLTGSNNGCSETDTILITVLDDITADFNIDGGQCGLDIMVSSGTVGADNFQWDLGDGTIASGPVVNHTYSLPGQYEIILVVSMAKCGYADTLAQIIEVTDSVAEPEIFDLGSDCSNGNYNFDVNNSNPRYSYFWDFGNGVNGIGANPSVTYNQTGYYRVKLTVEDTVCNKSYQDSIDINLTEIINYELVPNIFTPNGDDYNELLVITGGDCRTSHKLEIYNRWGSLMFETFNPYSHFWDGTFKGKEASPGVYYYILYDRNQNHTGHVTLIR